jgi:hypothetical protein
MKRNSIGLVGCVILDLVGLAACSGNDASIGATPAATDAAPPANVCGLNTKFSGDGNCILPPEETKGFQVHVGPSDYDNPDSKWLVPPGGEVVECYHTYSPNAAPIYYFKQQ